MVSPDTLGIVDHRDLQDIQALVLELLDTQDTVEFPENLGFPA